MALRKSHYALIISVACLVLLITVFAKLMVAQQQKAPSGEQVLFELGGPFELVDHTGADITEAALEGQPSMLFFGFTHCPDICPTTLYDVSSWLDTLGDEGRAIKSFFVTVDPARDTTEVMNAYVTALSDRITGITGNEDDVEQMTQSWRVYVQRVDLEDGDYTVDHSASIYLLNNQGRYAGTIPYGTGEERALEKLRALVAENS